jgi:hypothetical protein
MAVETPYAFGGGLDQTSASLAVPGGRVIAGMNYEPVVNGYKRVQGTSARRAPAVRGPGHAPFDLHRHACAGRNGTTITGITSGRRPICSQLTP